MNIGRLPAELFAAGLTGAVGLLAVVGSAELGASWTPSGPEPGYFPFYVGLILIAGSLGNALSAWRARSGAMAEPLVDREQGRRLLGFAGPLVIYVAASTVLGLYVASAMYVAWNVWRGGHYRPLVACAVGVGFAVGLYLVFDFAFQVPLLKGPLEAFLGIY